MIDKISPPLKDTKDERFRFYYEISSNVAYNDLMLRNHLSLLDNRFTLFKNDCLETQNRMKVVEEEIIISKARANTIISAVVVVWIIISAVFGWVWDKTTSRAEALFASVSKLEDMGKDNKHIIDALVNDVNTLKAMKSMLMTMQNNLETISAAHNDKK